MRGRSQGFTLIELLIVVAIIGIIAAIAIPNLVNAIDRGKQKRTMADIRAVGTACEAYSIDANIYPTSATITLVKSVLETTYIKKLPTTDGWNNPLVFAAGATSGAGYTVRSYGKDNTAAVVGTGGKTTAFAADIIFVDGQFTQWPEGIQQ